MLTQIILFDGDCSMCNRSVQFIIQRDPRAHFQFASLQSEIGKQLLKEHNVPLDTNSVILLREGQAYTHSTAVLMISKSLIGIWKVGFVFLLIPRPLRDVFYRVIAAQRHVFQKKSSACLIPTEEMKKRFL